MKNVSVPIKLIIIAFLFGVAGFASILYLRGQINSLRIERDEEERVGMDVLQPAYELQSLLVQRKAFSATGTTASSLDGKIKELAGAVAAADKKFQSALNTTIDKERMTGAWDGVAASLESNDESIQKLAAYQELVGDVSDLILDPELDTYWLMSGLVVTLPKLNTQMGEVREASDRWSKDKTTANRETLLSEEAKLRVYQADINAAIASAVRYTKENNPDVDTDANIKSDTKLNSDIDNLIQAGLSGAGNGDALLTSGLNSAVAVFNEMTTTINVLIDKRVKTNKSKLTRLIGFAFAVFAGLSFISWLIGSDITKALDQSVKAAQAYGEGDLRQALRHDRQDEIGSLLTALETMRSAFRTQIESLQTASDTNVGSAARIQSTASEVAATSAEMATTIAQASATVEEVRQTALLSEQKAKAMATSAQEAAKVAAEGSKTTQATAVEMEQVQVTMESIAESILQLSNQSKAISNIIASVNDLAEQSNVLAVNASIEAAKAGEFGRGFAVVAQEVKGLADESKQATLQVRGILQEIERSTAAAVMVAEQGSKATQAALSQAQAAGSSIKELGMKVVQAAQAASQISMSSAQQLSGMDQVVEAMVGIRDSSGQMVPSMNELSDSAGELSELADSLKQSVVRFKL